MGFVKTLSRNSSLVAFVLVAITAGDSSRDYNPSPGLEKIQATVLAINAADDERNPPEFGLLDREIKRVKNGRVLLIPASDSTAGHGTTGSAKHSSASSRN